MIERALGGLLIHREKLTDDDLTALTDCRPTQALTVCGEEKAWTKSWRPYCVINRLRPRWRGLTLSGGEPFMQPELAAALLKASHDAGIHTAVETCLHVPWKYIEPSLPDVDLFLAI